MQSHQDIWFSVEREEEHIYFRALHKPHPILDFIPWPIRVPGIVFPDGTRMFTAGGGNDVPSFIAGPGIDITIGLGTVTISTNATAQTPWLDDIDGAGFDLSNVGNLRVNNSVFVGPGNGGITSVGNVNSIAGCFYVGNVEFACANGSGGVNLSNIATINGLSPEGTPAGSNRQIQYNANGRFGASANFTWREQSGNNRLNIYDNFGGGPQTQVLQIGVGGISFFYEGGGSPAGFTCTGYGPITLQSYDSQISLQAVTRFILTCQAMNILAPTSAQLGTEGFAIYPAGYDFFANYLLDVQGDINITDQYNFTFPFIPRAYRLNGVPWASYDSASGEINLFNINTINGSSPGGGGGGGGGATISGAAYLAVQNTTSFTLTLNVWAAIPGCTVTITRPGQWLVMGAFYYVMPAEANSAISGSIAVNGSLNSLTGEFENLQEGLNVRGSFQQQWLVNLNAGDVVTLQGQLAAAATSGYMVYPTSMTLVLIGDAVV